MQEMKPAFALDFRDETVRLLHRTAGGWQLVGSVAQSAPDLGEALGYLRATALGLSPRGIATKLILPNTQILYTQVAARGPDAAKRRAQVAAGLEGRTPYAVDDLVYDTWGKGDLVQVAVIARETLAEAEAFAAEHRFNPVAFVAVPEAGDFGGEPWFGPTDLAATLLAPGEKVERDQDPVQMTQRSFAVDAAAAALPEAEPEMPAPARPDAAPAPPPELAPEPAPIAAPATPPLADAAPEPASPEAVPAAQSPLSAQGAVTKPAVSIGFPSGNDIFNTLAHQLSQPVAQPERAPAAAKPVTAQPIVEVEEAPMALDVDPEADPEPEQAADKPSRRPDPAHARVIDPGIADDLPPPLAPAALVAFSSRRQADAAPIPSPGSARPPRPTPAKPLAAAGGAIGRAPEPAKPEPAKPESATPEPAKPEPAKPLPQKTGAAMGKALHGLGALVTAPGIAGAKPRGKVAIPSALPPLPAANPGASAATTAAAARPAQARPSRGLGAKPAPTRGKPRFLGLILTVVLLFLLAMIAAWSSYTLAFWQDSTPAPAQTAPIPTPPIQTGAADPAPADTSASGPDVKNTSLAGGQDPGAKVTAPAPPPVAPVAVQADPAAAAPPAAVAAESADSAGSAAQTPPGTDVQNEIFLATADTPPATVNPLALPEPEARGDPPPAAGAAPPPFGTVYQFNPDGTIHPTPEGIITPEGVLLIAGKPKLVPAPRPDSLLVAPVAPVAAPDAVAPGTVALAPAEAAPAADATPEPAASLPVDPALAGKKPHPRPDGLVPAAAPANQGALDPAADNRFANLHPLARPAAVLAAGQAARDASASASLSAQAGAAQGAISPQAVSFSPRPTARPDGLAQATDSAIASVAQDPAATAAAFDAAAAQPDSTAAAAASDSEPDLASAAPPIPTKAAVAKQATVKHGVNLSKTSLIGVFGTDSDRYALVRLAHGGFKKVKVGDRLDGGRVAAITDTELRYQKGSKLVTLAMPKG